MKHRIVAYDNHSHREDVIGLWERVFGYEDGHNAPAVVIIIFADFRIASSLITLFIMNGLKIGQWWIGFNTLVSTL